MALVYLPPHNTIQMRHPPLGKMVGAEEKFEKAMLISAMTVKKWSILMTL